MWNIFLFAEEFCHRCLKFSHGRLLLHDEGTFRMQQSAQGIFPAHRIWFDLFSKMTKTTTMMMMMSIRKHVKPTLVELLWNRGGMPHLYQMNSFAPGTVCRLFKKLNEKPSRNIWSESKSVEKMQKRINSAQRTIKYFSVFAAKGCKHSFSHHEGRNFYLPS